jgi:hypothetical protein
MFITRPGSTRRRWGGSCRRIRVGYQPLGPDQSVCIPARSPTANRLLKSGRPERQCKPGRSFRLRPPECCHAARKLSVKFLATIFALVAFTPLLMMCEKAQHRPPAVTYNSIKDIDRLQFSMVALRSGVVFAFNSTVDEYPLGVRYSEQAKTTLDPVISEFSSSCTFIGFRGYVRGELLQGGRENSLMLNVDELSELRPLTERERQQFRSVSSTLKRTRIC